MVNAQHRIGVLLVDNLALVRQGIKALLDAVEDVEVVGEAATAGAAVHLAKEVLPDVVLLDQDLPGDSLQVTRAIKEASSAIEIIIMSSRLDNAKVLESIEAGATGYVFKDIPAANLVDAVRAVSNGRAFFHPEAARQLAGDLRHLAARPRARMRLKFEGLTARELDILIELARGNSDREIAARLMVSEGTIKTHIRHILRKLGARNRTQAVAHIIRKRIIE